MADNKSSVPLVVVRWNDAWVKAEDSVTLEDVKAAHGPTVVETIGWLLHEDEVGISLANEKYDGLYRGRTFIYRPMVISVIPYNLAKPRQPSAKRTAGGNRRRATKATGLPKDSPGTSDSHDAGDGDTGGE